MCLFIHELFIYSGWASHGSRGKCTSCPEGNIKSASTLNCMRCLNLIDHLIEFMQVDAAPAALAKVSAPAPMSVGETSEEETEVSNLLHIMLNRIILCFMLLLQIAQFLLLKVPN